MDLNFQELRPFQQVCIYKLQNSVDCGKNRLFINIPTGCG